MSSESNLGVYLCRCRDRSGFSVKAISIESRIAVRQWRRAGRCHVTVGNAGGVELELDGPALPAPGGPGQVARDASIPSERRP